MTIQFKKYFRLFLRSIEEVLFSEFVAAEKITGLC